MAAPQRRQAQNIRDAITAAISPTAPSNARRRTRKREACYNYCNHDKNDHVLTNATSPALRPRVLGLAALLFLVLQAAFADEISVATPAPVEAGAEFSVEWTYTTEDLVSGTTGDLNPFDILLRACDGGACENGACGSAYRALCEREGGCLDSDGSYDVTLPADAAAGDYVVMVTFVGKSGESAASSTEEISACSQVFSVAEPEVPLGTPVLEATTPDVDLTVGKPFTAKWLYDNGEGEGEGHFDVNLYSCSDGACSDGSCGTFVEALCGETGCYDPGPGDYDVVIPSDVQPGKFNLQIKRTVSASTSSDGANTTTATSTCTAAQFDIVAGVSPTPTPTTPTPQPASPPTAQPAAGPTSNPVTAPTPGPVEAPAATSATDPWSPGVPPTPVPARVTCKPASVVKYSYKLETSTGLPLVTISHESGDRDEAGCASLTTLWEWLATGPVDVPTDLLYPADSTTGAQKEDGVVTGSWLLRTSLDVTNGVTFEVKGTAVDGGDCDRLYLSSSAELYIRLRGAGGNLYIYKTHISSWVEETLSEHVLGDGEDGSEARSYVGCVSEMLEAGQTCDGVAQKDRGMCRMDIIESEMGYMGYDATESYGISWKVRGLCEDHSNVDTLFETVRVYGDLMDSNIHHMWYGMYSYGHLGGVWTNNLMHDNHVYGFDPHDDSDFLTITDNSCYNNGNHGIIASKRCDHLLIKDNECFDNLGSGLMLHQSCDDSVVSGNQLYDNFDAGLSLVETSRTTVTGNTFTANKWGLRILVGSNDNVFEENTFDSNTQSDVYFYIGSETDIPLVEPLTGFNERNTFNKNSITFSAKYTVDIEDSIESTVTNNEFIGTGGSFSFVRSNDTRISGNTGTASNADHNVIASCFTVDSGLLPVC